MAAVDSHKHPCGTFWRDNIINKGSELLMMRPSFLCGCLHYLSIMSREVRLLSVASLPPADLITLPVPDVAHLLSLAIFGL